MLEFIAPDRVRLSVVRGRITARSGVAVLLLRLAMLTISRPDFL